MLFDYFGKISDGFVKIVVDDDVFIFFCRFEFSCRFSEAFCELFLALRSPSAYPAFEFLFRGGRNENGHGVGEFLSDLSHSVDVYFKNYEFPVGKSLFHRFDGSSVAGPAEDIML